jgi:ADP-ribose pyrophosphatase
MDSWKTLSRETVLDRGKFLRVEDHTVELPDGRVIEQWPWIITPDFINVVALTDDDKMLCFRQGKYAIEGEALAPIGGYLEPGEEPLVAAQRELLEETGYQASDWIDLGHFRVDTNRGAGTAYFFMAHHAHPIAARDADDLEDQELLLLTRAEVEAALQRGDFKALPWMAIIVLALRRMEHNTSNRSQT